jgi:cytochrome o ubiquinol oxidase subunit 2
MKQRPALLLVTLIPLAGVLSGCGHGVLDPAGPVGHAERTILLNSVAIMLAIVVPTILCTLGFAWWYRASNARATYAPHWAESGRLELLVWSIPALVVLFLGSIAWTSSHDLDPARPLRSNVKSLEVEVVALDWKWLFIYPDQHVASVNRLVTPVGTPVHFRLTASSVLTSFSYRSSAARSTR